MFCTRRIFELILYYLVQFVYLESCWYLLIMLHFKKINCKRFELIKQPFVNACKIITIYFLPTEQYLNLATSKIFISKLELRATGK